MCYNTYCEGAKSPQAKKLKKIKKLLDKQKQMCYYKGVVNNKKGCETMKKTKKVKIDKRKNYYLVLDTETTNTYKNEKGQLETHSALVYDIGFQVIDKKGRIYEKGSYAISEIFYAPELMNTAFYKSKLPFYYEELKNGTRENASIFWVRKHLKNIIEKYNIVAVCCYNAQFDYNALNRTIAYLTGSACRFFFWGVEWYDIMKMATDTIKRQKSYIAFCEKYGFLTKNGKPQYKAETYYKYIANNPDFVEAHRGFQDVEIECEIMVRCLRQHKKMRKLLFDKK